MNFLLPKMKRSYTATSLLTLALISGVETYGQRVQWASQVVSVSSEFKDNNHSPRYRAVQATGKPNVMPQGGENPCAWSPKKKNRGGKEALHVRFEESMQIQQVAIAESFNCGTVVGVLLLDEQGKGHKIKSYDAPLPGQTARFHRIFMSLTQYKVKEVIVYLKTSLVDGYNHIDAIGISDSDTPIEAEINTAANEEEIYLEMLNSNVNSKWSDVKPMITPDGNSLFLVRKEHPENIGAKRKDDIWVAEKGASGWEKAVNVGAPLNNEDHNYVNGMSPDGNVVLLGNIYGAGENAGIGMSMSHKRNGVWEQPRPLHIKNYYNHSEFMEAHISSNLNVIVMTVFRNDTYGNKDLYVSFNQGGDHWSEPMNLGPQVNTASAEMAPFLAADGRTLYFSSAGFSGYGDYDIYMTQRLDDTWQNWSEPINMGPVINSDAWDAYLSLDAGGEYAFLSRGEKDSPTKTDIYKIHLNEGTRPESMQVMQLDVEGIPEGVEAVMTYSGVDDSSNGGVAYSEETESGHSIKFTARRTGTVVLKVEAPGYKTFEYTLDVGQKPNLQIVLEKALD